MTAQVTAEEVLCLYNPIMQSIQAKLDVELTRNQITGKDAGQLYLHALESTLHEVVLLLLGADQRKLILAQTGKENAGTNLIIAQKDNTVADGLNIPKQGVLLDLQATELTGKIGLIPKQSDLLDAQVLHTIRESQNLSYQQRILELQGNNLLLESKKLNAEFYLTEAQIAAMQQDAQLKYANAQAALTQAEQNRASAHKIAAEQAAMKSRALAEVLKIMVDSYNTTIAHTLGTPLLFDTSAIYNAASQAEAAISNTMGITSFTAPGGFTPPKPFDVEAFNIAMNMPMNYSAVQTNPPMSTETKFKVVEDNATQNTYTVNTKVL